MAVSFIVISPAPGSARARAVHGFGQRLGAGGDLGQRLGDRLRHDRHLDALGRGGRRVAKLVQLCLGPGQPFLDRLQLVLQGGRSCRPASAPPSAACAPRGRARSARPAPRPLHPASGRRHAGNPLHRHCRRPRTGALRSRSSPRASGLLRRLSLRSAPSITRASSASTVSTSARSAARVARRPSSSACRAVLISCGSATPAACASRRALLVSRNAGWPRARPADRCRVSRGFRFAPLRPSPAPRRAPPRYRAALSSASPAGHWWRSPRRAAGAAARPLRGRARPRGPPDPLVIRSSAAVIRACKASIWLISTTSCVSSSMTVNESHIGPRLANPSQSRGKMRAL